METVKKPEMLLSISNTLIIAGLGVYFYKQQSAIKSELSELQAHVRTIVPKIAEISNALPNQDLIRQQLDEFVKTINTKIDNSLTNMAQDEDLELVELALENLSEALRESGIVEGWDFPPKKPKRKKQSKQKRRTKKKDYISDISEDEAEEDEDEDSEIERSIAQVRRRRKKRT
jgi:hypothetical protein